MLARIEMSNSLVVIMCHDYKSLEVWRWAVDQRDDPVECDPKPQQIHMYQVCIFNSLVHHLLTSILFVLGGYEICWLALVFQS